MDFGLNRIAGGYAGGPMEATMKSPTAYTPRTLREQISDNIAHHRAKIADLEAALDAMTPDVEKALNALQKLSS